MVTLETPFRTILFGVWCFLSKSRETNQHTAILPWTRRRGSFISTGITTQERKQYDDVVAKFDQFFEVRKNTMFEQARFNRWNQLEGESATQYITVLFRLADNCDYGEFKSQMMRDSLVVGIRDNALYERLQMNADLTLERAMKLIRQSEAVHEQQALLNGKEPKLEPGNLDSLKSKKHQNCKQTLRTRSNFGNLCGRCGKGPHSRNKCSAREATCHRCHKKGHCSSQCHTKMEASKCNISSETSIDTAFLDVMTGNQNLSWKEEIYLNKHPIQFKLDTAAEVTAISETTFANIKNTQLQKASRILLGPARQKLEVLGQFDGHFLCNGETCKQVVFVVKGLKTNLLGLPTIVALKLVARVNEISDHSQLHFQKSSKDLVQWGIRTLLSSNLKHNREQSMLLTMVPYLSGRKFKKNCQECNQWE